MPVTSVEAFNDPTVGRDLLIFPAFQSNPTLKYLRKAHRFSHEREAITVNPEPQSVLEMILVIAACR